MRTYQKKFMYITLFLVVILIISNIISTPAPTDLNVSPDTLVFAEDPSHWSKLEEELEQLQAMHHSHTEQISTLRDTVVELNAEIKNLRQQKKTKAQAHVTHNHEHLDKEHVLQNRKSPKKSDTQILKPSISLSGTFELIPDDDIIYPQITISNADVSDTPSSPKSIVLKDIRNDNVIYDSNNGVIHGNPLLLEQCSTVLTADHEVNILSSISFYHNSFVPWFWSRESIASVLQNQPFTMPSHVLTSDAFDNATNAIYIEIDSSASYIVHNALLKSKHLLQQIAAKPNTRVRSECGFTLVQHPITRFVSAYFSVNILLWKEVQETGAVSGVLEEIAFHKVARDLKGRFKAFINDLRKYRYAFLWSFPSIMNALISQTGLLSFSQNDIDHIFKYESIQKEYENILTDPNDEFCVDESDHFVFSKDIDEDAWDDMLLDFGINKQDLMDEGFRTWMGLKVKLDEEHSYKDVEDLVRMDMLYVYDVMDYELYSKIVEYYWQDFVCFDYAADYKHDVLDYLTAFQDAYPGFNVINRTKTNWDSILEYYYSKKYKQRRW
eukprot:260838_1